MNYKSKFTIGSFPLLNLTWGVVHDCQWQVYSGIIAIGQNAKGSSGFHSFGLASSTFHNLVLA